MAAALVPRQPHAQQWPREQTIHIVATLAPDSSTDLLARFVARSLAESLGQAVIVSNRAGGTIGARYVKDAAADGYTLLATSVAFAVNATLQERPGYDPFKDFVAVALAASTPNVIAVHPSVLARDLRELVDLARRQPLSYASSGTGTTTHLSMERLKAANRLSITHLPRQPAQAVAAAVRGQAPISSTSLPPALNAIREGRLRAIAVTSARRAAALPDVPTVAESGYPGFDDVTWFGFFAPARTPAAIVSKLNGEINRALEGSAAREKLGHLGLEFASLGPQQFSEFLRQEVAKWAKAVKDSGARAD